MKDNRSIGRALSTMILISLLSLSFSFVMTSDEAEGYTTVMVDIEIDGNDQLIASSYRSDGGSGTAADPYIFEDLAMNTHILKILNTDVHFTFRNVTFSSSTNRAIHLENVKNANFINITTNYRRDFLNVVSCSDVLVDRSTIVNATYSSSYLIKVYDTLNFSLIRSNLSKSNSLSYCIVYFGNNGESYILENNTFKNIRVYENRFDDNERYCNNTFINSDIILGDSGYNVEGVISHNEFYNSTLDVIYGQRKFRIDNNRFENDQKNCIELDYTYECTISNNHISGYSGIYFQNIYGSGSKDGFINRNIFESCHFGISTLNNYQTSRPYSWDIFDNYFGNCSDYAFHLGYSLSNRIWHNRFYHNAGTDNNSAGLQVHHTYNYGSLYTNLYTVDGVGNFWSNYRTPDVDNNGIVDQPLTITTSGVSPVDEKPFTNPYFDTTPPQAAIIEPAGPFQDNSYFVFKWSAKDDDSGVSSVELNIDDKESKLLTGSTSTTLFLPQGPHDLELTVLNGAGLRSVVTRSVHVNSSMNVINIYQPDNGSFLKGTEINIRWSITAEFLLENLSIIVNGDETFLAKSRRDITLELEDGEYEVIIQGRDIYGMLTRRSIQFTMDNLAPDIRLNAPTPYSYLSNNDVHFNWDTYDRYGVKSQFIRYDQGDWMENTGASSSIWIFGPGPHTCDIRAVDRAGNEEIFHIPLFLGIDPRFEIMEPVPFTYTRTGDITLRWKYNGPLNWTRSLIQIGENGDLIDIEGSMDHPVKLEHEDEYLITLRLQDDFFNYAEATTTVIKDRTDPIVLFRSPMNNSVLNDGELVITWRGEEEFGVREYLVRVDEGEWENLGNSTEYEGVFDEGTHIIEVKATDHAGNTGYGLLTFTIDSEDPIVVLTSPVDGSFTTSYDIDLKWIVNEFTGIRSITLTVDGDTSIDLTNFTRYDLSIPKQGMHLLEISVLDLAGNAGYDNVTIYIDKTRPDLTWKTIPGSPTNSSTLEFAWDLTEKYPGSLIFSYGDNEEELSLDSTYISIEVDEGTHEFFLTAEDKVGNKFSISYIVLVDRTPPTIIIDWDRTEIKDSIASIYWTIQENVSSEVYVELDHGSGFRKALIDGRFTTDKLSHGDHFISIRATDGSGNSATDTWEFFVNAQGGQGDEQQDDGSVVPILIAIILVIVAAVIIIIFIIVRKKGKKEKTDENDEKIRVSSKPRKLHIIGPPVLNDRISRPLPSANQGPLTHSASSPVPAVHSPVTEKEDSGYIRPKKSSSRKKKAIPDKIPPDTENIPIETKGDEKITKPEPVEGPQKPQEPEVPLVDLPDDGEIPSWHEDEIPTWDDTETSDQEWTGENEDFPQEVEDDDIQYDEELEEFEEIEDFE